MGILLSCIVGAILFTIYILLSYKEKNIKGLLVKSFVSVSYLLVAAFSTFSNPDNYFFGILVIIAGILGLKGDIYLEQKWMYPDHKDDYMKIGFICFGIGHIFYIWAMYTMIDLTMTERLIPLAFGILLVLGNLILEKPTKQKFGKYKGYVCAYGLVLGYTTALGALIYCKTGDAYALVFAIGGVSFMVSDLVLSQIYFGENKNTSANFVINMITYYLAQFVIALTPAFIGIEW